MKQNRKIRTQISLDPELDERVIKLADKLGMSKPQVLSMLVAQQIDIFEVGLSLCLPHIFSSCG